MSLRKEELVLAACLLETTDASLSAEDAMGDVKQIMMNLPESLDPAYRGLLAAPAQKAPHHPPYSSGKS